MRSSQLNFSVQFTPMVKKLVILNTVIWFVGVLILQNYVFKAPYLFDWFGLIPYRVINEFWIWQPFTYMFLHSSQIFHLLFNMLLLWWIGSELETRWGSSFFLFYYVICGLGAGIIYTVSLLIYYLITDDFAPLAAPVVGASGSVFGLMLAYGMLFGERTVFFMMIFPMKAKYFVMLLGGIEVVTLLNSGVSGGVANLAHLGGIITGFLFLVFWTKLKVKSKGRKSSKKQTRLKLVVDNEGESGDKDGPRYWN